MDRMRLYAAWDDYYRRWLPSQGRTKDDILLELRQAISSLRVRMMRLGAWRSPVYHGFKVKELVRWHGMSLGIHQQVLGGLTSLPRGGNLKGGGGVKTGQIEASVASFR